ncbi:hypothetical protein BDY19DRAFT_964935 [Irpex rosettiformis]|uniref:Uncharacterized protein n=1 Tax=Irpex rosettiformis TaxID=378272 RepID=A0ACB8TUG2_9APHY|nr:hypothetical protein BDY19DRAFT_964935 [Irpex rosettiformis]
MAIDAESAIHLKPWLVRTLEPICDAEPGALADYILALLKHNAPEGELRQELSSQLEEFLEKETQPFIQTLFTALRTKSYMPYAPSPPRSPGPSAIQSVDNGIPIPLDLVTPSESVSPDRRRKRSLDTDDRDYRQPKGPRLNDDGSFQRYGRADRGLWREGRGGRMMISGRADYMDGGADSSMDMGMGNGMGGGMMNGRGYRPPDRPRGICRDYHNNGYCARGAFCKYSHGEDAVIPGPMFPLNGMPGYNPVMPFPMAMQQNSQYNPHERMEMRPMGGGMGNGRFPHQRAPLVHRDAAVNGTFARKPGELPVIQDLTPRLPLEEHTAQDSNTSMPADAPHIQPQAPVQQDVDMSLPPNPMAGQRNGFRSHRGGGRGTFGDAASFRPERRNDKTLVVEKIPEDKLSLGAINDWFKKFGTVTNVAVDPSTSKALVSFSDHKEAHSAWKSEEAVFGNRFVKVFWHRPLEGHGQKGSQMLAASANLVAKISTQQPSSSSPPAPASTADASGSATSSNSVRKPSSQSSAAASLAAKHQLLEQQIAEQKSLMTLLASATGDEKKQIMTRLRKLNEEMKPKPESSVPSSSAAPGRSSSGPTLRTDVHEAKERERLDKELELHSTVTGADVDVDESTDELKARLEKLKAEAASLGISEDSTPTYSGPGYRPYRGRGRGGRSFYRGNMRGGPPRGSMKLDNRPKKLLVKGVSSEEIPSVRDWYETTGQVDSVDTTEDGDVVVGFKSRAAAEQGLSKGNSIPTVGSVQVSWFTTQQPTKSASTLTDHIASESKDTSSFIERVPSPGIRHDDSLTHEDEPVAVGGWGGDDADDDFGMM